MKKKKNNTYPVAEGPLLLETRENWTERFGREGPVEVEIGFGYGNFLLEYSLVRPDLNLVGFEIRKSLANHVAQRAEKLGRKNIIVFRGNARMLLPVLFGPESLNAVHILFPDPWWKKRHKRRRLVDPPFITLLHRLLKPDGHVCLRTDVEEYGYAMIETFEDGSKRYENMSGPASFSEEDFIDLPSNREKRYLESDTPVYRLVYRKR